MKLDFYKHQPVSLDYIIIQKWKHYPPTLVAIRDKRGAVWFNETAWKTAEELAVVENYINVDTSFSTSTEKIKYYKP